MPNPEGVADITAQAREFLSEIASAEERQFPSVGHGTDFRYRLLPPKPAEGGSKLPPSAFRLPPSLIGSALIHENEVIHVAFFRLDDPEQPGKMASLSNRRRHFRE